MRVNWRLASIVLAGFAVAGAITVAVEDDEPADHSHSAFIACKEFVRRDLRAPATAEFRNYAAGGAAVSVAGTTYTVTSSVDSQNGFGALIRSHFTCTVRREGGDWRLMDLDLI